MGKNLETQYSFRCDEETIKKLEIIAKKNTRTRNQEMKHIIKKYIENYEKENGEIVIEKATKKEAWEKQMQNIQDIKNKKKPIGRGLIDSFKSGTDYGNADK